MIDDPTKALPPDSPAAFVARARPEPAGGRPAPEPRRLDAGRRPAATSSTRWRRRTRAASPSSSRSGSAGCSPRRSRSCADRRRSWPPTSRTSPAIGSLVQLCGDAHLANFGVFASPERRLVFDLNDFDETYRGPWEWDLKRLAASVVVASRENGFTEEHRCRDMARIVAWQYRRWMRRYAGMRALQVWYAAIPIESIIERVEARPRASPAAPPGIEISMDEARRKDHMAALGKLSIAAPGGGWLIRDRPPLLQRLADDDPSRRGARHTCGTATSARWRRTAGCSSRSIACSTSRSRSSGSAASARAATSPCSPGRPAGRSSSRSRRRASRSWRRTSAAGAGATRASGS